MPFTPSHIAAVLPLRGRREGLPLAALAAGSMSPDFMYYLPLPGWGAVSQQAHSLPGIFTWDLLFGVSMWAVWRAVSPAVHDLAPRAVRRRWRPATWPAKARPLALVVAAVLVGAATHVVWDGFTHGGGFAVRWLPVLAAEYSTPWVSLPGYQWLQYASGVIGLVIVAWAGLRQPVADPSPPRYPQLVRATPWVVGAAAFVTVLGRLAVYTAAPSLHSLAFVAVTAAIAGFAVAVCLLCVVYLCLPTNGVARH